MHGPRTARTGPDDAAGDLSVDEYAGAPEVAEVAEVASAPEVAEQSEVES